MSTMQQSRLWFDKVKEVLVNHEYSAQPFRFDGQGDFNRHLQNILVRDLSVSKQVGTLKRRKNGGKWKVQVRMSADDGDKEEVSLNDGTWGFDTIKLGNRSRITELNFAKVLLDCYKVESIGSETVESGKVPLSILEGGCSLVQMCELDFDIQRMAKNDPSNVQLYDKASAQIKHLVLLALREASSDEDEIPALVQLLLKSRVYSEDSKKNEHQLFSKPVHWGKKWLVTYLLRSGNEEAIALPAVQAVMSALWTNGSSSGWYKTLGRFCFVHVKGLIWPFWVCWPKSATSRRFRLQMGRAYLTEPRMIFLIYQEFRLALLALLVYISTQDSEMVPSAAECVYAVALMCLMWQYGWYVLAKSALFPSKTDPAAPIRTSFWMAVDMLALLLSLVAIILRASAWAANNPAHVTSGNTFLGLSIIFFVVRMLEITLVYKPLGTLMLIIQTILSELVRYIAFQVTFLLAFGLGLLMLIKTAEVAPSNVSSMDPWSNDAAPHKNFGDITTDLFFSLFGLIEVTEYSQSDTVLATYAVYLMVSAILLLNLLIAMLNKSYLDIEADADQEYKLKFSELVLMYKFVLPKLPPPLSTLWRRMFHSHEKKMEEENAERYYRTSKKTWDSTWEAYNGVSHLQLFDAVKTNQGIGILKWISKDPDRKGKIGVALTSDNERKDEIAEKDMLSFGVSNPVLFGLTSQRKPLFRKAVMDLNSAIPYEEFLVKQAVQKAKARLETDAHRQVIEALSSAETDTRQVAESVSSVGRKVDANKRSIKIVGAEMIGVADRLQKLEQAVETINDDAFSNNISV